MENKREIVIQKILDTIKRGEFSPDHQLPPERKLAQQMGVSRVLLREAVVALETLGVLEVRKRQGIFVKKQTHRNISENIRFMPFWTADFIPQLMEVRLIIDVNAAKFAAIRRTDDDLQKMKNFLTGLESLIPHTEEEIKAHARYEFLLHSLIVEAAHNTILSRIYEGIVSLVEKNNEILHQNFIKDIQWQNMIIMHHRQIFKAIQDKDPQKSGTAMAHHIEEATTRFNKFLNQGTLLYPHSVPIF
jgi:GntR family transcriptional repressor for pyruvate dehydrogenase complex